MPELARDRNKEKHAEDQSLRYGGRFELTLDVLKQTMIPRQSEF